MIKANELRIGNLYNHYGEIKCVTPSIIVEVWESERKWCEPIELTEEFLLKLGFNTNYKKGYIGIDPPVACSCDFVLSYPYRMGEWQTFFAWEFDNYKFQKLEYVHELQNLYFALTGSELVFSSTEP